MHNIITLFLVLFGTGDVIAQVLIGDKDTKYDYKRTGRAWIFGTFLLGPLAHWHFNFLEWLVVRKVCCILILHALNVPHPQHADGSEHWENAICQDVL